MKKTSLGIIPNNYSENTNIYYSDRKKYSILFISICIFMLFFIVVLYILFNNNKKDNTFPKNTYIENIIVSGKTENEVISLFKERFSGIPLATANFKILNNTFYIKAEDLDYSLEIEKSVEKIYNLSKNRKNNAEIRENIEFTFDQNKLDSIISKISSFIPNTTLKDKFQIKDGFLEIYKGNKETKISNEELTTIILNKFKESNINEVTEIPVTSKNKGSYSIHQIFKTYNKEPINAEIKDGKIVNEQDGLKISLTINEAQKIYDSNDEYIKLPIEVTKPEITKEILNKKYFANILAQTKFNVTNLSQVDIAQVLDELIIENNSEFSFKNSINLNDSTYNEDINLIASQIYNICLLLNLDIIERNPGTNAPSFIDPGLNAHIDNNSDLKFRNNKTYPIKIKIIKSGNELQISFLGSEIIREKINIYTKILNKTPKQIIEKKDFEHDTNYKKIIKKGADGVVVETYRKITYLGGDNYIKKISTDTFKMVPEEILVGAKIKRENKNIHKPEEQNNQNN